MSRPLKPATAATHDNLCIARRHLELARAYAKSADCPRLVAAIRRALKSADGAQRHADRRVAASEIATDRIAR